MGPSDINMMREAGIIDDAEASRLFELIELKRLAALLRQLPSEEDGRIKKARAFNRVWLKREEARRDLPAMRKEPRDVATR